MIQQELIKEQNLLLKVLEKHFPNKFSWSGKTSNAMLITY